MTKVGVEHALFCKKCKVWVDGHKNWALYFTVNERWCEKAKAYVTRPENWEESQERGPFEWYWSQRMFAFLWKHKDHGAEVAWMNDGSDDQDEYYKLTMHRPEWVEEWPTNTEQSKKDSASD